MADVDLYVVGDLAVWSFPQSVSSCHPLAPSEVLADQCLDLK